MDDQNAHNDFALQQIVCIEEALPSVGLGGTPRSKSLGDRRLYASVIQFIPVQTKYWLRPLCLVRQRAEVLDVISLHRTSDLIIHSHKLREAWDTEILEFWSDLYDESGEYHDNLAGRAELQRFLRNLSW